MKASAPFALPTIARFCVQEIVPIMYILIAIMMVTFFQIEESGLSYLQIATA